MKKYLSVILASILIGLGYNLFFASFTLIPNGLIGLGALFSFVFKYNAAIFIAISNIILLTISLIVLGIKQTNKYLLPSLLIPIFIFLFKDISTIIDISEVDITILSIAGACLLGFSYSLIYNEGLSIGGFEIIQDIINKSLVKTNRLISIIIDFCVVILCFIILDLESAIYTIIITVIVNYLSTKSKIGISSNKTFYIITTKEKEVKDYLINDLNYDYTEFNVKGGFTNQKNKIIMTVIDTKDYYQLKEGISLIDPKAFISIIDNYETINKNVKLGQKLK